jgi:hypothetical protein
MLFLLVTVWQLGLIPQRHRDAALIGAEYAFFLAATLAGLFILDCWRAGFAGVVARIGPSGSVASGIAVLLFMGALGMHQFGGFDHSTLVLSGWVVRSGLVPFRDVPCTLPPLFVIGSAAAMAIFGVRWWAFVVLATAFSIATFVWLAVLLNTIGFRRSAAIGLALTLEISTVMVGGFWWYNPISSVALALIFASSLACQTEDRGWAAYVSLAVSLCLLLMSKPNAWPAFACAAFAVCGATRKARTSAVIALAAGTIAAWTLCVSYDFSPIDVIRSYMRIAGTRGTPFSLIVFTDFLPVERGLILAIVSAVTTFFIGLLLGGVAEWRPFWRQYGCCLVVGATSVLMTFTDYELKTSDLAPMVVAIAVMAYRPWSRRQFEGAVWHGTVAVVLGAVIASTYWSATRLRVRAIGEEMFFQYPGDVRLSDGFFAGVTTGPRLARVLVETGQALRDAPGPVFFGPRMEFLYAVFKQRPPTGLPVFWHPGSAYALSETPAIADAFVAARFGTLVFLRNDFTRMPPVLLHRIGQSYALVDEYQELTVFRLRSSGAAPLRR